MFYRGDVIAKSDITTDKAPVCRPDYYGIPTTSSSSGSRSESPELERPPIFPTHTTAVECSSINSEVIVEPLETDLDQSVLQALGSIVPTQSSMGQPLHDILVGQINTFLKSGVSEDCLSDLLRKYPVPKNCPLIDPPKLNVEMKSAINEGGKKRDERLMARQKEVGVALTAVARALSTLLFKPVKDEESLLLIETLSNAICILSKIHHSDSMYRRSAVLSLSLGPNGLQRCMKEALVNASLDCFLFGEDLSDTLKSAKAIGRSVADLRAGASRTRPLQHRDLNSTGPLRSRKIQGRIHNSCLSLPNVSV
ncbi:uncharacterized protein LOC132706939 [Cylas formicarius]|uniref:uncharacterized protein LOC132706939 n=1 Tax=Cylas formicarius TaxID=197179 RepID=UPI0029589D98|nr:uncharacterized protein LOC132706939 [Cylas formicarius]